MVKGLQSNGSESKQLPYDLKKPVDDEILLDCSICLEPLVNENNHRTLVTLRCEHQFHLDCIGSAFNAKNKMECPNCRNVEQGQWLYASGIDGSLPEEGEDNSEIFFNPLDYEMELCPFEGYVHLNSTEWATGGHYLCDGLPCCNYHDFIITNPLPSAATGVIDGSNFTNHLTTGSDEVVNLDGLSVNLSSQGSNLHDLIPLSPTPSAATGVTDGSNFTNHLTTGSDEVVNLDGLSVNPPSHGSNPHDLIPLSTTPTNPRFFQSASEPDVIIARCYISHPHTNPDLMEDIVGSHLADEYGRLLHNMLYGDDSSSGSGGSSDGEGGSSLGSRASGSGGGNSNNGGSG